MQHGVQVPPDGNGEAGGVASMPVSSLRKFSIVSLIFLIFYKVSDGQRCAH
jgi:hypothetical protein